MSLSIENQLVTICQATQHGLLIPWGRFARYLKMSQRLRAAVPPRQHSDALAGGDLILEFGLAALSGCEYLQDLNLGAHPLAKDQAVQDAWDLEFRHYTTVSRFLYELDDAAITQVEAELQALMRPYLHSATHEALCQQPCLTLCGDLTGRPVSAYSTTYPPDTVFGYMANQLCKGHQAVLVTLKGLRHRVHVVAFHHAGDTVSGTCLREMVAATEERLGCRPRRRTALVQARLAQGEAQIAQRQDWIAAQQGLIHAHIARQIQLGDWLQALRPQLHALETQAAEPAGRPHSKLAQARQRQAGWERQLRAALAQEHQARRALAQHQQRLTALLTTRETLLHWLAQLEIDNATCPAPVRIRWLLDGGFGDVANITYLIEMGYDVYAMAHNGKTTQVLLKTVPADAPWTPVGARTEALDTDRHELGACPYPVRLTLLRWAVGEQLRHSTLISFSADEPLPTADLFPTYHARQDVEAGIKQGKGTFGFTKLRVRSPAGIRLLGQFALVFWPNFVQWAADWLGAQAPEHFVPVLQQVRTQVRTAANTPAVVLTNASGQMLEFAADSPYAGVQIRLDSPFAYQCPMPLFQTAELLWPISSESVKEQLSALLPDEALPTLADLLFDPARANLREEVPEFGLVQRLPL